MFGGIKCNVDFTPDGMAKCGDETVIVLGFDGVISVFVAAGASDRQCEKGQAGGIDHVVQFIVTGCLEFLLGELGWENARSEEPSSHESKRFARSDFVPRHLPPNELGEWHVLVECLDDKIAVVVGMRSVVVLLKTVALSETGHIQPVTGPALSKMRGMEQFVHNDLKGLRLEVPHIRKSDKVKMQTSR